MNKINLPAAAKISSPNPVTLVCTKRESENTNLATVSWWMYLSYNPNMIAYAMAKTSYSGETVRQTKKVILTIPSEKIISAILGCGSTTGRNTNKVEKFNIELQKLPGCEIEIPIHSCLAIVCNLKEFIEVGDHYLYICNVESVYGNEQESAVFAWNGYGEIGVAKKS